MNMNEQKTKRPKLALKREQNMLWHAVDVTTGYIEQGLCFFRTKRLLQEAVRKKYPIHRFSHDASDALQSLKSILQAGEDWYLTSKEIHDKFLNLRKTYKLNAYDWGILEGYRRARWDYWDRYYTVYCIRWNNQLIVNKWDNLPEDAREFLRKASYDEASKYTGVYWKERKTGQPHKLFY